MELRALDNHLRRSLEPLKSVIKVLAAAGEKDIAVASLEERVEGCGPPRVTPSRG